MCKTEVGLSYDPRSGETLSDACSVKNSIELVFNQLQNIVYKKYNNYTFTVTHIVLDVSAHVAALRMIR